MGLWSTLPTDVTLFKHNMIQEWLILMTACFKSRIGVQNPDSKEIRRKILEHSVVLLSLTTITGGLVRIAQYLWGQGPKKKQSQSWGHMGTTSITSTIPLLGWKPVLWKLDRNNCPFSNTWANAGTIMMRCSLSSKRQIWTRLFSPTISGLWESSFKPTAAFLEGLWKDST